MDRIIEHCRDTFRYSVKTAHPYFFNQLYGPQDMYGLAGQLITDTLNASQYTYEVAPVFTLMEDVVLRRMRVACGWTEGDGIFCPGGSIANMYAMNAARYHFQPDIKEEGLSGRSPLVMYTNEQCHFSIQKGAAFLGFGTKNVIAIKTDERGKMIPADLEEKIRASRSQGKMPMMVIATSGTTVLGAFDPIQEIDEITKKHNLWLHVDAAWGGAVLLSKTHRHKMDGVEHADSVTWCPHKLMSAPLQCSALLLNNKKTILKDAFGANAKYLFQKDKFYDVSYDTGDKSLQCSRKVDAFKIWLMWKAKGNVGFEKEIDNKFMCAEYLAEQIKKRVGFQLLLEPECTNVSFWYIPPCLRGQEDQPDYPSKLHKVAPQIKAKMMTEGTLMITYQPLMDKVNFFRMIVINSSLGTKDMDFVLNEIERLGKDIVV